MLNTFLLTITLSESSALTDGSSDAGGGHTTLPYIPGTSILGACVGALGIKPGDALFSRLFLSPQTRFLNAYPSAGGSRTLPRPLTFKTGKLEKWRVHDSIDGAGAVLNIEDLQRFFANATPPDAMKSTRLALIAEGEPGMDCSPGRVEQVHVGIDRTTRAASDGVLFTYEAVCGGTCFLGVIETEDAEVFARLKQVKECTLRIGRSRSAGYGLARATIESVDGWREYEVAARQVEGQAIVTLLSDYLPHIETAPLDVLRAEIAERVGIALDRIAVRAAALRQVRGFRSVWGLPRPARTAIAKGSVLVIEAPTDAAKLQAALAGGLGARTNEGFGRVAINWQVQGMKGSRKADRPTGSPCRLVRQTIGSSDMASHAIAHRRSDRLMRAFVAGVLETKEAVEATKALMKVPPSQLGNLRAAVSGPMTEGELGEWFQSLVSKTAGDRWKRANVPSLLKGRPRRAGHAFVWESLLGGSPDDHDAFADQKVGIENWKKLVDELAMRGSPSGDAETVKRAARDRAADTIRLIILGLISNTARARNMEEVDS